MMETRVKNNGQRCYLCEAKLPPKSPAYRNAPAHPVKYYCPPCMERAQR